ncbi:recombinase family protein [Pelobacter seleniigenes]|uniref:recombinase family protein n=1 Tax=Pelobacter seleniigenes TaxID=407188 RepID=UPI0004A6F162|nr:recombinase family protein [Pelobacter seleniigenes]
MNRNYKVGYARVSTTGQNLDAQLDELREAGCQKIFCDQISGVKEIRPEWGKLLEYIRPGDILVITELSRMSRSLIHLLEIIKILEDREINIQSLREEINTTTATGRAFISIMGAINQMERELKAERTAAGRAAAKARGKSGGRPRTDPKKLEQARIIYENSSQTAAEVCSAIGVGRRTFFSYMAMIKSSEKQ